MTRLLRTCCTRTAGSRHRRISPPRANVTEKTYAQAADDVEAFWAEQAKRISWDTEPTQVLDWSNPPFATWFADGTLNAAYNCLDRHVEAGLGDRVAFHFEGEPGDTRTHHLRRADQPGQAGGQRPDRARRCRPATGSRSTCR